MRREGTMPNSCEKIVKKELFAYVSPYLFVCVYLFSLKDKVSASKIRAFQESKQHGWRLQGKEA